MPSTSQVSLTARAAAPAPSDAASLPCIGAWQPVRRVGEGAMAVVYQARPAASGANAEACYAVKVLKPRFETSPLAARQFQREAQVGRQVSHPHLISILDRGVQAFPYYVVMPYLAGSTLADQLCDAAGVRRMVCLPRALWIARQVAQGLAALHAARWMHCDIKPANIFVAFDGHATLLDLGLARNTAENSPLADRAIAGTLDYMAPEMLTSALAPDIRSDLYSLGVTLFEMLAGRLPHPGRSTGDLPQLQCEGAPPDLRKLFPDISLEVSILVRQLLARDPLRRPQSPQELIERLIPLEIRTFGEQLAA